MKKIIISIIVMFVVAWSCVVNAAEKATINTTAVRMRKEASTDSEIVTVVYEDDECEVLESDGEWSKIKYGDFTGFVKTEFLNAKSSSSRTTEKITNTATNNVTNNLINDSVSNETKVENKTKQSTTSEQTVENTSDVEIFISSEYTLKSEAKIRAIPCIAAKERNTINAQESVKVEFKINNWCKISNVNYSGWITEVKLKKAISENIQVANNIEDTEKEKTVEKEKETEKDAEKETEKETENESISTSSKKGIINVETARVREKASSSSEIIGTLDYNEIITIVDEEGDFYKFTSNSISGYVAKKLVDIKDVTSRGSSQSREEEKDNTVSEEANDALNEALSDNTDSNDTTENNKNGNDVVEFAKQYLGYSYVSGGKKPETGFDCSGFTKYVFGNFGIEIGATAASQNSGGQEIARENLQPGDLIIFMDEGNSKIGHVGIYIGNGEFIHSANPKRGVVTDNLNTSTYYNARYVTARRLL